MKKTGRTARRLLFLVLAVIAAGTVATSPAYATGHKCEHSKCIEVYGSGNHVRPRICMGTDNGRTSGIGHIEVRHQYGGVSYYENSDNNGRIKPDMEDACFNVDFWVDSNTYVCGRFWEYKNGAWYLTFGDWTCLKTHP